MLNNEVAEVMKDTSRVYDIAEKTTYKQNLTAEEKETSEVLDAWAKEVGKTGNDSNKEIAAFVTRTIQDELYQRHKKLYSKVNLLNSDFRTIDSLEGVLTNGTLTISANSDTRRTFTCNMHLAKTSAVTAYNVYDWANKYLRVFIGIEDVRTKIVHWYEAGLFIPTQNGFQYDTSNNTLSLSCVDLTGKLDDTTCGQVTGLGTIIKTGRYIRQSMIEVLKLGGITKYLIDYPQNDTEAENDKTKVPYDLEFGTGATVWNMLTTLRDLYYPYEMFFDGDTFVCKEIPSCKDDPVILNHEVIDPLIISENTTVDETTIRNCTEVWGYAPE